MSHNTQLSFNFKAISHKQVSAEFSGGDIELFGKGRSKYSLEYLMKFIKGLRVSHNVVISFSDDYPLRLDFPGEKMGIGFVLAPRIEND